MKNYLIFTYLFFNLISYSQQIDSVKNPIIGATLSFNEINTQKSDLFLKDFIYLTPANAAKQTNVHPRPNTWNWSKINKMLDFANFHNLNLRIHGPISPQSSKWAKNDNRTKKELVNNMNEFLIESCKKYNNEPRVKWMDVVNETVLGNGKWFGPKPGDSKWENPWLKIGYDENNFPLYILKSFEIANEFAPNVSLVYNQNGGMQKPMWNKIKLAIYYIRSKGLRVDGIGWQGHLLLSRSTKDFTENIDKAIQDLSDLIDWAHQNDLDFHVTELDYLVKDKSTLPNALLQQKIIYSKIINLLKDKSKNGVVTLNFWDMGERYKEGVGYFQSIYSKNLQPNPSYELLKNILK
ncbi:endo-1,4-beta-xylanase [Flavobacteriaceae bacterium]|nr:endo-1,4-beta-xylanase [Flavobacteriaceae bacterium]